MCPYTLTFTTRCSHPLCNTQHTTTPKPDHTATTPTTQRVRRPQPGVTTREPTTRVSSQDPTACRALLNDFWLVYVFHPAHTPTNTNHGVRNHHVKELKLPPLGGLLRKEVIQPHLPVRLPCYDFVPIASPTFDNSLPTRGLGHRLRVLPTFVT
jgi:hypothetical protein